MKLYIAVYYNVLHQLSIWGHDSNVAPFEAAWILCMCFFSNLFSFIGKKSKSYSQSNFQEKCFIFSCGAFKDK